MSVGFVTLWENHPGKYARPCNFDNQCAIRMGIALEKSGVDLSTYKGARCWYDEHKHILRAQELANWISRQNDLFGIKEEHKNVTYEDFIDRNGIVFIQDGWGATDHIDLWNGNRRIMKGGGSDYFSKGRAVWFWELGLFGIKIDNSFMANFKKT